MYYLIPSQEVVQNLYYNFYNFHISLLCDTPESSKSSFMNSGTLYYINNYISIKL